MNINHTTENSRTAGTMPVWGQKSEKASNSAEEFGFNDLVDMINPLQHIPLVNMAYQKITGDNIKPISQVIGGAVYGGAIGAGGALANVAIEAKTGKDIGEHAIAMVDLPASQSTQYQTQRINRHENNDDPETNLNNALKALEQMDAHSAIAYADLGFIDEYKRIETKPIAEGRTAGHRIEEHFDLTANQEAHYKEPISEVTVSAMPARKEF
ncbi:MAG: hypothetical protein ACPG05_05300 [Bdellovibrionales bacterium]